MRRVKLKSFIIYRQIAEGEGTLVATYFIETSCQAGLLGGGEDESPVVTLDHGVWHPLEVPRPLANLVWKGDRTTLRLGHL